MNDLLLAFVPLLGGFAIGSTVETTSYDRSVGPPRWVFPVAWTILYAILGYSAYRVGFGNEAIILWWAGLLLNFMWSPVWFGQNDRSGGLMILQALIVTTVITSVAFYRVDKPAGLLQIPYLLWLGYAHYLSSMQQQ